MFRTFIVLNMFIPFVQQKMPKSLFPVRNLSQSNDYVFATMPFSKTMSMSMSMRTSVTFLKQEMIKGKIISALCSRSVWQKKQINRYLQAAESAREELVADNASIALAPATKVHFTRKRKPLPYLSAHRGRTGTAPINSHLTSMEQGKGTPALSDTLDTQQVWQ